MFLRFSTLSLAILSTFSLHATEQDIERIVVQGDFRQQNLQQVAGSVAVLTEQDLQRQSAQHLDDALLQFANVNFAAGASRGRFIQIRGIGERSEFIDVINPSVGILIDGIDYAGLGISSVAHPEQLEVFRGPEATRFGTNALAGMVNFTSKNPTFTPEGKISASLANYDSGQLSGYHSAAVSEQLAYSLTLDQQKSDGFIENTYLNRANTNNIDEFTGRFKLQYLAAEQLQLGLTAHVIDQQNGYDAFSLDRNRTTLSDEPGQDKLRSKALALNLAYQGLSVADFNAQLSYLNADSDYGFDEDWSYRGIHPWEYSYQDRYLREREQWTLDYRLVSKPAGLLFGNTDWVFGLYGSTRDLTLERLRRKEDKRERFASALQRRNLSLYGETHTALTEQLSLVVGGRIEQYKDDYLDVASINLQSDKTMWGAKISLNYQLNPQALLYGLVSRGYKVGGINGEALSKAADENFAVLATKASFNPESVINAEFGVKGSSADGSLTTRVATFYMWRKDMQVKGWINPDLGPEFAGFIDNAASGRNYGVEMETRLQLNSQLQLFASAGYLQSRLGHYVTDSGLDLSGRDQAHAPRVNYSVGADWLFTEQLSLQAGVQGKSSFYYSDGHNAKAGSSELVNVRLNYQVQHWELALWVRNALDKDVGVRGFYFGNDPRDEYAPHVYEQFAEPRRIGITASYSF
ncbi:TonB-dependent receptor [Alishewanella longhuensis]|uniref:TonB-dependent receptor n=1 Tax=Alishewanella longhuensis TaxID=1091037 RepID=A0ABQ3LAM7_9ALTE|nr:TonB-dependent receptor [Alishewanella longhuensis]GHG76789.1 TonB-dependent receptor [Alishewanella longhuensis]